MFVSLTARITAIGLIMLPALGSLAGLAGRVEIVRQAIAELNVPYGNRTLGSTSMSFGIATWSDGMDRDGSTLIQAADMALYQSKRDGRNRAPSAAHRLPPAMPALAAVS